MSKRGGQERRVVSVVLTAGIHDAARHRASELDVSVSALVRWALSAYLDIPAGEQRREDDEAEHENAP